jgi:hypothetical protein
MTRGPGPSSARFHSAILFGFAKKYLDSVLFKSSVGDLLYRELNLLIGKMYIVNKWASILICHNLAGPVRLHQLSM